MNSLPTYSHHEAHSLITWFDNEPSLQILIITGAGNKAFCAGQDLIEQAKLRNEGEGEKVPFAMKKHPPSGFCGISRRAGKSELFFGF